jgi:cytochrome b561
VLGRESSVTLGRLLVELLPITILSALTPWAIVGVIVLLASKGGVTNAVAFTLGWFTAIVALGAVIVLGLVDGADEHSRSTTWLQIGAELGFGIALLLFARVKWRSRPPAGQHVAEPRWIHKLDAIGPVVAFAFGAFWINGFLVIPAALQISRADVNGGQKAFALLFYAVGASAALIVVIAYRLVARERADARLVRLRGWVGQNSSATLAILLAAIGIGLVVKAVVEMTQS